ncbi:MAG: sulfite exporter TauE/SafE family protein [Pseudomonadota bacterium]
MTELLVQYGTVVIAATSVIALIAGFVKGAVGFALPMIMVSGVGALMSADAAVAAIIVPGLVTNAQQAIRDGLSAAIETACKYWRLNLILLLLIGIFAQLLAILPDWLFFMILGSMVSTVGVLQLIGWRPRFSEAQVIRAETLTGFIAAVFGGLAGVWGPPILLYLLARNTPKAEQIRAQGIAFLIGCSVLLLAHIRSGILDSATLPFSAWLAVPAVLGMLIGVRVQDRLNQERFRTATLIVLVIAGLNLLRRGLFG